MRLRLELHAKRIVWDRFVAAGSSVEFRVTCRKSKMYHSDAVAQRFASGFPPLVHWEGVDTRFGPAGVAPLLADARGWIEAAIRDAHDAGDHTLYVADVLSAELGAARGGLVYLDRSYHGVP